MLRILLTGASGFIGRHALTALAQAGHEVLGVDSRAGDVAQESTWNAFPQVDVVVHLAGKTFVPESWKDPSAFVRCNLLGTVEALNYCRRHGARLVYVSSYLYGTPEALPIPETAPLASNNPYALSKTLAENACRFYSENFGLGITVLRPFNVFGPEQPEHFLVPAIIRQVRGRGVVHVNDLAPRRDYVYVTDVADAVVKAVTLNRELSIFNVGSGKSHSVGEIVRLVQDLEGVNLEVRSSNERRKGEVMDTIADITAIRDVLGWVPTWTLTDGLRQILSTR